MRGFDQKSKNENGLVPYSKFREWKFLYFEPGRPGLEDGNGHLGYHRGLCKYCGLWKTCTQLKPEGGVWRCRDYVPWQEKVVWEDKHENR